MYFFLYLFSHIPKLNIFFFFFAGDWLEAVTGTVLEAFGVHCLRDLVIGLDTKTAEVRGAVPTWDHIFAQGLYLKVLAQKESLKCPSRDKLAGLSAHFSLHCVLGPGASANAPGHRA